MRTVAYSLSALAVGLLSIIACATDGKPRDGFTEPTPDEGNGENKPIAPLPATPPPCTGLGCAVPDCPPGSPTIIEGDVYDPAAKTKLYNVLAYVPEGDLPPLEKGASCDQCGKLSGGKAVTTALSNEKGHFRLENTPAGDDVPVVLQVGKFRRKILVPHVDKCTTNTIADKVARLPRNQNEGDLPKVAAVTGAFDELYCLLLRVGIDATEHTTPDKSGAVHVYRGHGGPDHLNGGAPDATSLWNDVDKLAKYDIVLLGCEGEDFDDAARGNKTPAAKEAMREFAAKGGRIFATHYQSAWVRNSPEPDFKGVATWRDGNSAMSAYGSNIPLKIDSSFPKGQAFATWMKEVNVSPSSSDAGAPGIVLANNVGAGIESVAPSVATRWLYREDARPGVTFMSFNAPVGAAPDKQCGRAVISDLHFGDELSTAKPPQCGGAVTPAGLALEFLLFDLSACIQPDDETPKAPK